MVIGINPGLFQPGPKGEPPVYGPGDEPRRPTPGERKKFGFGKEAIEYRKKLREKRAARKRALIKGKK